MDLTSTTDLVREGAGEAGRACMWKGEVEIQLKSTLER